MLDVCGCQSFKWCLHWRRWHDNAGDNDTWQWHTCTCLGHLGQGNINRNDPICVVAPKVTKASKTLVAVTGIIANKCRHCKWSFNKLCFHWQSLARKCQQQRHTTATAHSHYWTCLGHLGQHDTDRKISISVTLPRQVKKATSHHNIANVFAYKLCQCNWGKSLVWLIYTTDERSFTS
jgi:hypothetical protein